MPTKHNPLTFYLRMLLYMAMAFVLRLVAFAPIACLFVFPSGSPWRYLALLCPLLLILVVLPLRFSFAEALVQKPRQRYFSFDSALSMRLYGEKLSESLLHALNVLKWGLPLAAMLGGCYYCYSSVDMFTLLGGIGNVGKTVVGVWNSVANFFITLFGSINTLTYEGGLGEGLIAVGAVLGVGVLIWLYGAMRNSATRYIWVLATRGERSPRVEIRRRLRGRRWRQFLTGLLNLVLWSPFAVVMALTVKDVIGDTASQLMMALAQQKLPAVDLAKAIGPVVFAFLCLYFPLLPARRYITATFATRELRHTASAKPEAAPVKDKPMPTDLFDELPAQTAEPSEPAPQAASESFAEASEPTAQPIPAAEPEQPDATEPEPAEYEIPAPTQEPASSDGEPANDPTTFTIGQ